MNNFPRTRKCLIERDTHKFLQQNKADKFGEQEERRYHRVWFSMKKNFWRSIGVSRNAAIQHFGRLRWWYYLQKLQNPLEKTGGKMWRLDSMRYMWLIYLPKVLWREMFLRMMILFVVFTSDHKYYGQISIQLSTWVRNHVMKLSAFIEPLLISITWVKIFQFFPCVFTWNQPSTTQNVILSAWLLSMEIWQLFRSLAWLP